MIRSRLLILFSIATLAGMGIFTAVIYHGHVKAANEQDLSYLQLYVGQLNEKRRYKLNYKNIPLPYHVVENNSYQIVVPKSDGEDDYWLKTHPFHKIIKSSFPFAEILKTDQIQGHQVLEGEDIHWIKLNLTHPTESILFIHPDSDHWHTFSRTFGSAIILFSLFIFWSAIWSALILSNLFKRVHDKNELLQEQAIEICNARDEAYAAAKAKSRFLANISHELRTPLTAILGFSENMLDTDEPCNSQAVPLQTIIRNGNHLLHIINELLDLSKIEEDKLQIERIDFSVVQLLQDVELLMHQQAEDKGLEFSINYAWPLPEKIKSDPFRIKQTLLNLCSNAIKFTENGYIHINVHCHRAEELLHFEVIDTGIGIDPEQHEQIFQAFDQADVSTTRQYGGTGLGLSLTKRLVQLMGGNIELSSEPGKGSRFIINIPTGSLADVEFIANLDKNRISTSDESKPEFTLLKGRVLAADDAPDNRLLLSALLSKFGLQVTMVENGQLVLDTLQDKEFDLILLDIQMPVLDGLDTIKKLQAQNYDKPIIALTANTLKEDRKLYQEAGFTDFISKPIRFKILNKILSQYLQKA